MTDYKKWEQLEKDIPDDEEDVARAKLRAQKDDMSEKEIRRLHECWEKPEFKQMFQEYAEEVSDPAHKAEQEAYLRQVEAEQRADRDAQQGYLNGRSPGEVERLGDCVPGQPDGPTGAQLITPIKGFVVKTWQRAPGRKDFDRELGKVFINVVHHEEIDPPKSQTVTAPDGRKGESWSMPHLVSPKVKEEQDKSGHKATVIDICFHTEVVKRTDAPHGMGDRWKEMVAKTAVEMCSKLHSLDLDQAEYKTLKMKYFGHDKVGVSTMSWRPAEAFNEEHDLDGVDPPPATGTSSASIAATLQQENLSQINISAPPSARPSATPPTLQAPHKPPSGASAGSARASGTKASSGSSSAKPRQREPKYSVVHRGVGDLSQSWTDTKLTSSGRPRELCVKVELPELSSAAEVDLDITERRLELKHEGVGYVLVLPLPYPVLSEQGSAKFDKAKKTLTVTLPVLAEISAMPQWAPPTSSGQTDADREAEMAREKAEEAEKSRLRAEADEERRQVERETRKARAAAEEVERQARIHAAQVQADKETARRARLAAGGQGGSTKPKPPPAVLPAAPPTAAAAAEDPNAEWVVVPENEANEAKVAAQVAEMEAATGSSSPQKVAPRDTASKAMPAAAATPPADKSIPAFSNELLFELD